MDAVVFTAGIGEHSPKVRARVCEVFPAPPTAFLSSPNRILILPRARLRGLPRPHARARPFRLSARGASMRGGLLDPPPRDKRIIHNC